jgi:hypothetical protein
MKLDGTTDLAAGRAGGELDGDCIDEQANADLVSLCHDHRAAFPCFPFIRVIPIAYA